MPPDVVDLLEALQLRWENDRLSIAVRWRDDPQAVQMVRTAILGIMRYKKWSESRWVTIGTNCKSIVASLLVGIVDLTNYIRARPRESEWFIKGMDRLQSQERQFFVVAAIVSHLSDSVLCNLLEDGRLTLTIDAVLGELSDEQSFATMIPDAIFEVLLVAAGISSLALRTEATAGVFTSAAFLQHRLRSVQKLPWTLCGPGKQAKLEAFARGPEPSGGVEAKIHKLLAIGYPMVELIDALVVMENIDWTITPAEQGHRHATGLMRSHQGFCQNTMQARSQLGQVSALWPSDMATTAEASLLRRLHRLERSRPQNLQGRQEFAKECFNLVQKKKNLGLESRPNAHQIVMRKHSQLWSSYTEAHRQTWEAQAAHSRAKKRRIITEQKEECVEKLAAIKVEKEERQNADKPPCRLSACCFSPAEVDAFDGRWNEGRYSRSKVDASREAAVLSVGPPPEGVRLRVEAFFPARAPPPPATAPLDEGCCTSEDALRLLSASGSSSGRSFPLLQVLARQAAAESGGGFSSG